MVDKAIRWINLYPGDNAIDVHNTYPQDSDLFSRIALSNFWTTGARTLKLNCRKPVSGKVVGEKTGMPRPVRKFEKKDSYKS